MAVSIPVDGFYTWLEHSANTRITCIHNCCNIYRRTNIILKSIYWTLLDLYLNGIIFIKGDLLVNVREKDRLLIDVSNFDKV